MAAPAFDPVVTRDSAATVSRLPGFLIGGGLPLAVAIIAMAAERALSGERGDAGGVLGFLSFVGLLGVPIGALLGWLMAPRAARAGSTGETVALGLGVAGVAVVLGTLEVSALFLIPLVAAGQSAGSAGDGAVTLAFGFVVVPVLGLLIFGLPAFVITAPIAILGAALVRALARRTPGPTPD